MGQGPESIEVLYTLVDRVKSPTDYEMWQGPKSIEVLYTSVDCEDCSKEMSILIIRATSVPEQLQKLQRKLTEKEAKIAKAGRKES